MIALKTYLNYEIGDIIAVELPFSDMSGSKLRPVLVLSSQEFNMTSGDIIVAKISSKKHGYWFEMKLTNRDLEIGKLKKTSFVDLGFIITIDQKLVKGKIGRVNEKFMERIKKTLKLVII